MEVLKKVNTYATKQYDSWKHHRAMDLAVNKSCQLKKQGQYAQ